MTAVPQVDPRDVPAGATIIDVREDYEWEGGHATGAKHITLGTIAERLAELPAPGEDFYVICHGGGRSNQHCRRHQCVVCCRPADDQRKRRSTRSRSLNRQFVCTPYNGVRD